MTALGRRSSASLACSQMTITASAGSEERSVFFRSIVFLPSAVGADVFWLPLIFGDADCLLESGSCECNGRTRAAHRISRMLHRLGEENMNASSCLYHITSSPDCRGPCTRQPPLRHSALGTQHSANPGSWRGSGVSRSSAFRRCLHLIGRARENRIDPLAPIRRDCSPPPEQ